MQLEQEKEYQKKYPHQPAISEKSKYMDQKPIN